MIDIIRLSFRHIGGVTGCSNDEVVVEVEIILGRNPVPLTPNLAAEGIIK